MKRNSFLYSLVGVGLPSIVHAKSEDRKSLDALNQFYQKLRRIPAWRVVHDLKLRGRISSIELITRCAIAGTDQNIRIEDAFSGGPDSRGINGKLIEWSDRMEKESAEYVLKVITDSNSWMVSFSGDKILIHRYRT